MNKQTYELIGVKVKEKKKATVYAGKNAGKPYWQLLVEVDNRPEIKKIKVFSDKVGLTGPVGQEQIWKDIEESNYADKRYFFYHQTESYGYVLTGWKELTK